MEELGFDLIVGVHSIAAAIKNSKRSSLELTLTDDGEADLLDRTTLNKADLDKVAIRRVSSHKLQELGKELYKKLALEFQRIPSQCFLTAPTVETKEVSWLYESVTSGSISKILMLDQITDVHNAAAIFRTANFYGVDAIVVPGKRSFKMTPSFFRIASGAAEYNNVIYSNSFTKVIKKLVDLNVKTLALSEHANSSIGEFQNNLPLCLVLGREDKGISNALLRLIESKVSLTTQGDIKSLNVSVAAAVAMEKCFGLE